MLLISRNNVKGTCSPIHVNSVYEIVNIGCATHWFVCEHNYLASLSPLLLYQQGKLRDFSSE